MKKFEIWRQSILKVIQAFHTVPIELYIGCSGQVIRSLIAYELTILRLGNTGTMPLTTQILRTASK